MNDHETQKIIAALNSNAPEGTRWSFENDGRMLVFFGTMDVDGKPYTYEIVNFEAGGHAAAATWMDGFIAGIGHVSEA